MNTPYTAPPIFSDSPSGLLQFLVSLKHSSRLRTL